MKIIFIGIVKIHNHGTDLIPSQKFQKLRFTILGFYTVDITIRFALENALYKTLK